MATLEGDEKSREERIAELKRRARQAAGGELIEGKTDGCPPELEESFFDYVAAYEEAPYTTNLAQMKQAAIELPAPDRLDDLELSAKLWQLIDCLARHGVQLEHTDHLSDRELYAWLLEDGLTEETKDLAFIPGTVCHLSPIGSGSEEDTLIYLKYYADERWRKWWHEEWPDFPIPEHEDPPHDRDRHLPDPHDSLLEPSE
jgi:hypothetical protein